MKIKIRILSGNSEIIRNVTLRYGWFGMVTYVTVQGREHRLRVGDTLTLDIPITLSLGDSMPEE